MSLAFLLGFFGVVLLLGSVGLGLLAWYNHRESSRLDCRLLHVDKLRPGYQKARGKIVAIGEPLVSPVTNRPCVYYKLIVYEEVKTYRHSNELPGGIVTAGLIGGAAGALTYNAMQGINQGSPGADYSRHHLFEESFNLPMMVEDETGLIEVDLRSATIVSKEKSQLYTGDNHPPPDHLMKLVTDECDIFPVDERGFPKSLQFLEEALFVGAKVTVLGTVETLKSGNLCFRNKDTSLLVSERNVAKQGQAASKRAIGFAAGAGGSLLVAVIFLAISLGLTLVSYLSRK